MELRRRPVDLARHAAAIARAEGWEVLGRHEAGGAGESEDEVSVVVGGGTLRGRAVLTVARARATPGVRRVDAAHEGAGAAGAGGGASGANGMTWDGIASPHLPRSLPPPDDRRARRGEVAIRLREHPGRGTLDDLLSATGGVTAGEAVTALAAVARGLSDLHGAGRGGVRLTPADIGFRHDGCPVLTAVDRLSQLDQRTMAEDVAAFAVLAGTVCRAVAGAHGPAVLAAATDRRHGSWEDVVAGVLRAADPTAVRPVSRRDGVAGVPAVGSVGRGDGVAGAPAVGSVGRRDGVAGTSAVRPRSRRDRVAGTPARESGSSSDGVTGPPVVRPGRRRDRVAARRNAPPLAALPRDRPRESAVLAALERLLDLLGDRPASRALGAARAWIAARPALAVVAGTPPAVALLLLVVLPDPAGTSG